MRNLTLLTDLYQLTMLNGYFEKNIHEDMVIFDMFFRKNACNGGYTIVCGIEQFVEYINNIHFSEDDLAYLKSLNLFLILLSKHLFTPKYKICEIFLVKIGEILVHSLTLSSFYGVRQAIAVRRNSYLCFGVLFKS